MADTLKKPPVDIAIVGFGWTGGIHRIPRD